MTIKKFYILCFLFLLSANALYSQSSNPKSPLAKKASAIFDQEHTVLEKLYKHLHTHPELSFQEKETAALLANELRKAGFTVTENIGGYGVVGVLKNGSGPTVMVRADMDALPIKEDTMLPYASKVTVKDSAGKQVPVMHACGHDLHMAVWVGVAKVLTQLKSGWKGTLVFIAQPAEEKGTGAKAMIKDGLFTKFPRPDYGLALHVNAALETGKIGFTSGYALSNVDNITIKVKGKGGHGAAPHKTIDPIVIASKIILSLQTIISRELSPVESPAVLTVGSIHGGTTGNIIPNEVDLALTLRSYGDKTRQLLIEKIKRTGNGIAMSSGLEKEDYPIVKVNEEYTPSVYNNPVLTRNIIPVFKMIVGNDNVHELLPEMVGEDFSNYTRVEPSIPTLMYSLGSMPKIDPQTGKPPTYFTHSSKYYPVIDPSLKIGVMSMSMAVMHLLKP
jgi:amidohydrolase